MAISDVFDEIISSIQPENVPLEFIMLAQYTDHEGKQKVVRGPALEDFMKNPHSYNVLEARVVLNIRKLQQKMTLVVAALFSDFENNIQELLEQQDDSDTN